MPSFSFMNTPGGSDALANFGWPLDHSLRTGRPPPLVGSVGVADTERAHVGFTPLPQGSAAGSGAPGEASAFAPTSPQTAALFAMMTNNTPGAAQPAHASAKERNAFEASFAASSAGQRASSGTPVTSAPFPGNMSAQQHHMALPAHMQHQVRQIPIASGGGVPGTGAPGAPGVSAPGQHNPLFMLSQHAQEQHRGSPVSGQQQPPRQPSDRGPQQRNGAGEHDDLAAAAALSNLQSGPFSPMPQEVKDALAAAGASVMPGQTVAGAMSAAASGNTMNAPTKSQPHQPQPAYSATVTASASGLPSRQPNKRAAPSSNASGGGKRRRGAANRNKSADFEYDEDGDGDSVGVKDEGDDYDDVDDQQGSARKPSRRASARRGKAAVAAAVKGDDQMGPDDDDMDDDMEGGDGDGENMNDDIEFGGTGKGGRKGKGAGGRKSSSKFETDDDKRRNFLERNRQAALKCRQRKKAWLASLQQKVEYLSTDNETLSQTIGNLKEEIQSLRSILAAHANCPIALENQQRPPSQYAHRQPVQGRY